MLSSLDYILGDDGESLEGFEQSVVIRFLFFFFLTFIYLFIFIFGCVGSSFLCEGFL